MYAVFAGLLAMSVRQKSALLRPLILTVIGVAAFGAVDEWHQQFIPGRSMEFGDWVADSTGGVAGAIVASLLILRTKRLSA